MMKNDPSDELIGEELFVSILMMIYFGSEQEKLTLIFNMYNCNSLIVDQA
jgi:hypothetical protein